MFQGWSKNVNQSNQDITSLYDINTMSSSSGSSSWTIKS